MMSQRETAALPADKRSYAYDDGLGYCLCHELYKKTDGMTPPKVKPNQVEPPLLANRCIAHKAPPPPC